MKFNFKKYLLKFWPVIAIFAVWFAFSNPYFLKNKVPFASTYQVNFFAPWVAYPGFASPVKNNAMPDIISQIYPWKHFTIESLKQGELPLWNPYSFSGTPHLANYQSAVLSPFNLLFFVLPFIDAWSILVLLQPLLAGIFMFYFLRSLAVTNKGSLISAVSFMFCGFLTTWMGYATLGYAILFLPLSLFAIEKYYKSQKLRFLFLLSLTILLSFFSGHFQISVYFFLFVIAYLIFKFFQTKNIHNTFYLILYTLFGFMLSLPQILPSMEVYQQSLRSGIFQKAEFIPWDYLATFFAPDFLGNPVTRNDWFGHYAEWNAYLGVIPIFLSFFAIFYKKIKLVAFFIVMAAISILLSFDTPILDFLVKLQIPVLSTSAASRVIILFSFSFAVLAGLGFDKLLLDLKNKKIKQILIWIGFGSAIFIFLWAVVLLKLFIPLDKIIIAKQNLILPTALFIALIVPILFSLFQNKKYPIILTAISFIIIFASIFDLFRFATKWQAFDPKSLVFPKVPVVRKFTELSGYERFLGNLGGEATVYYKLPSLEGYDAVYIRRYGEFIASLDDGNVKESARSVVSFPKSGLYVPKAINLLNIKYIVYKVADGRAPWAFPFWTYKDKTFKLLYNDGNYQILENTRVFPKAFLVGKYKVESDPQRILNTMFDKSFDLRNEVVLEINPKLNLSEGAKNATIKKYTPNKVLLETNTSGNSLLFLSDVYFPGWSAMIDGKDSKIFRANYAFRAVFVPSGKHNVEFVYKPLSFTLGVFFAVIGLVLMFITGFLKNKRLFSFPEFKLFKL